MTDTTRNTIRLVVGIVIALIVVISAVRKNKARERELEAAGIDLENKIDPEEVLKSYYQMVGMNGFAVSQLAPYGRVMIYGKVFQACCEECVVEKGDTIEVIGVNERTLIVKRLDKDLDELEDEDIDDEDITEDEPEENEDE